MKLVKLISSKLENIAVTFISLLLIIRLDFHPVQWILRHILHIPITQDSFWTLITIEWLFVPAIVSTVVTILGYGLSCYFTHPIKVEYKFCNLKDRHYDETVIPNSFRIGEDILHFRLELRVSLTPMVRVIGWVARHIKLVIDTEEWVNINYDPRNPSMAHNLRPYNHTYALDLCNLVTNRSKRELQYDLFIHLYDDTERRGVLRLTMDTKHCNSLVRLLSLGICRIKGSEHVIVFDR